MPTYQLEGGGELHLDYDAVGALLRSSAMQGLMADAAHAVAAIALAGEGVERVWVDTYTTDRGAASVTIAVRGGDDAELKYGILSDAALQVGLEYAQKGG
jgi:hypothetical protein